MVCIQMNPPHIRKISFMEYLAPIYSGRLYTLFQLYEETKIGKFTKKESRD